MWCVPKPPPSLLCAHLCLCRSHADPDSLEAFTLGFVNAPKSLLGRYCQIPILPVGRGSRDATVIVSKVTPCGMTEHLARMYEVPLCCPRLGAGLPAPDRSQGPTLGACVLVEETSGRRTGRCPDGVDTAECQAEKKPG